MTRTPTGTLRTAADGTSELALTRTFRATVDEVWASITESDRLARWYGPYVGETGPGRTIQLTMTAEEGAPTEPITIVECEPPHRLVLELGSNDPAWRVTITVAGSDGIATLEFVHHLTDDADAADFGPGWEYYLDRLEAAEQGDPLPDWDGTYLALSDHYRPATG